MFIIALVLILGVGIGVGYMVGTRTPTNVAYEKGLAEGREAAKKTLMAALEAEGIAPAADPDVRTISGVVTAIEGDTLVIETQLARQNPLKDPLPKVRRVRVTSETTITKQVSRSDEEVQAEMRKFNQEVARIEAEAPVLIGSTNEPTTAPSVPPPTRPENPDLPTRPEIMANEKIDLADITIGSMVSVTASASVYSAASFDATSVLVLSLAAQNVPGMPGESVFPKVDINAAGIIEPAPVPPPTEPERRPSLN